MSKNFCNEVYRLFNGNELVKGVTISQNIFVMIDTGNISQEERRSLYEIQRELHDEFPDLQIDFRITNSEEGKSE